MRAQISEVLQKPAEEESTYGITLSFKDNNRSSVTPKTLVWTLMTEDGTVINGRYRVSVGSLDSSVTIVLSGDDLQLVDKKNMFETRVVTIEATYDSVTYGDDLPFKKQFLFKVRNIILIALPLRVNVVDAIFTDDYLEGISA